MIVDPEAFKAALSALASTLSITASVRKIMDGRRLSAEEALESLEAEADEKQKETLGKVDVDSVLKMTFISGPLLDQYAREAQRCEDRLIDEREKADTNAGKQRAEDRAQQCMCSILQLIKKRNNGDLPSETLRNWWVSYQCEE